MSFEAILSALEGAKERGGRYTAKCPAHDDKSPSLMISERDDGSTSIYCFAGCSAADVLAALGLSERDAWKPLSDQSADYKDLRNKRINVISRAVAYEYQQIHKLYEGFKAGKITNGCVLVTLHKTAPSVFYLPPKLDRSTKNAIAALQREWWGLAITASRTDQELAGLLTTSIIAGEVRRYE